MKSDLDYASTAPLSSSPGIPAEELSKLQLYCFSRTKN